MLREKNTSVRKNRLHQKFCGEVATAKLCQMQLFFKILNYFNLFITNLKLILSGKYILYDYTTANYYILNLSQFQNR